MAIICLLLIPVSLLMSLALSACLIGVARLMGQMDEPGREDHKGHDCAVPNTGGSAIFLSVLVPIVAVLTVVWLIPPEAFTGWLSGSGSSVLCVVPQSKGEIVRVAMKSEWDAPSGSLSSFVLAADNTGVTIQE